MHLHCRGHHSRRSFTFGLLTLVLIWGALRTCFWLATSIGPKTVKEADSNAYFVVLKVVFYWVPFALQFTSYSIFSLFLGKVVYRNQWKRDRCKRTFLSGFIISNALLFVFVMVWATWSTLIVIRSPLIPVTPATHNTTHDHTPSSSPVLPSSIKSNSTTHSDPIPWVPTHHATCEIQILDAVLEAVMGSSFTVLFLSFTMLTIKYFSLRLQITQRMLVFRPNHLAALCVIMSIVFFSRAAVNFYNFSNELTGARDDCSNAETASNTKWNSLNLGSAHDETPWAVVMALIWEIIPTMLILVTIATRQGRASALSSLPGYGAFDQNGSGRSSIGDGGRGEHLIDGRWKSASGGVGRSGGSGDHPYGSMKGFNGTLRDGRSRWSVSGSMNGYDEHGGMSHNDEIESAKRWLEGGDLFQDDMRYDSLPSDSNFDGHMMGRFGSAGGRSQYGKSYQSSGAGSSTGNGAYGGLADSVGSEGGVWGFGSKWNSPPGEMGRFGSLKVPSRLGTERAVSRIEGAGGGGGSGSGGDGAGGAGGSGGAGNENVDIDNDVDPSSVVV
jgi:hypothetical protein